MYCQSNWILIVQTLVKTFFQGPAEQKLPISNELNRQEHSNEKKVNQNDDKGNRAHIHT